MRAVSAAALTMTLAALIGGCSNAEVALPPPTPAVVSASATVNPVPPTPPRVPPAETAAPPTTTPIRPAPTPAVPTEVNGIELRPIQDPHIANYPTDGIDQIRTDGEALAVWTALVYENYLAESFDNYEVVHPDFERAKSEERLHSDEAAAVASSLATVVESGDRLIRGPQSETRSINLDYRLLADYENGEAATLAVQTCRILQWERFSPDGGITATQEPLANIWTTYFGFLTPDEPQIIGFEATEPSLEDEWERQCTL